MRDINTNMPVPLTAGVIPATGRYNNLRSVSLINILEIV